MQKIISGKVRDVYTIDDRRLVIVTSDRISAYDVVLKAPITDKGKVLNTMALFWFDYTKDIIQNHLLSAELIDMPSYFQKPEFAERTIMVKKLRMLPYEFIVRGYIFGNMWQAYQEGKEFCGLKIEGDYQQAQKLTIPILTPSRKMNEEHDIYISFEEVAIELGSETAEKIKQLCLKLYEACYNYAYAKGIIIADTKFEFGVDENHNLVLADEIFTPDSSRFWSLADYAIGVSPKSYDKQFIRDWLMNNMVDGVIQFDNVPPEILTKTALIYQNCLQTLIK